MFVSGSMPIVWEQYLASYPLCHFEENTVATNNIQFLFCLSVFGENAILYMDIPRDHSFKIYVNCGFVSSIPNCCFLCCLHTAFFRLQVKTFSMGTKTPNYKTEIHLILSQK